MTDLPSVLEDTSRNVLVLTVYCSPHFLRIILQKIVYLLYSEDIDRIIKIV